MIHFSESLLTGERVRLALIDEEKDLPEVNSWNQDSEYFRLSNGESARFRPVSTERDLLRDEMKHGYYYFAIRTIADDQLIGVIDVGAIDWISGNCWLAIGIGPREFWGRGYGTEAMALMVKYAFWGLNLKRVTLNVFAYNERAVRCYLKTGFQIEGRMREFIHRDGKRYDLVFMGLLREEWEQAQRVNERSVPAGMGD